MTNGQLVIGHTSNPPGIATLTAGTGIAITNGAAPSRSRPAAAALLPDHAVPAARRAQEPILEWDPDIFVLTDDPANTATSVTVTSNVALFGSALTGNEVVVSNAGGRTGGARAMTNGQLVIGDTSNARIATLTAGTGIAITNGAGSITIAAGSGVTVVSPLTSPATTCSSSPANVTGLSFAVAANTTYTAQFYLNCSGSTGGMKFSFTGPASSTAVYGQYGSFGSPT